jgi:hypothetical protein
MCVNEWTILWVDERGGMRGRHAGMVCWLYFRTKVHYIPSALYTKCTIYQVHYIPSALYTKCNIYQMHYVPSALYIKCTIYQVHHIPSALYIKCTIYQVHYIPSALYIKCTIYQMHYILNALYIPLYTRRRGMTAMPCTFYLVSSMRPCMQLLYTTYIYHENRNVYTCLCKR